MSTVFNAVRQDDLIAHLKKLFPNESTIVGSKRGSQLRYTPLSRAYFELDAWIPTLGLGFEFQDPYHYVSTWYSHTPLTSVRNNDNIKKNVVHKQQMSLIDIPCWWDGQLESLSATIHFCRPDIVHCDVDSPPISFNPPEGYFPSTELPGVGELMLASFPIDPQLLSSPWWIGEKYDGVRCCWNPLQQVVYSRTGREIQLLPSLQVTIPPIFIDSEFWFGRGMFSNTYFLCKSSSDLVAWDSLRMCSFDVPEKSKQIDSFEDRFACLLTALLHDHLFCIPVARTKFEGLKQIQKMSKRVLEGDGEGIILQQPGSTYIPGRSSALLKLKTSQGDREGLVVSLEDKSVTIKLTNGNHIEVPADRVHVPLSSLFLGDIVTVTYDTNSSKLYHNSSFLTNVEIIRKRDDVEWQDVLVSDVREERFLSEYSQVEKAKNLSKENMRAFMINFARSYDKDPFELSSWQSLYTHNNFMQSKNGKAIIQNFKGLPNAVRALFPEIGKGTSVGWKSVENRRRFFEEYASAHGFDPLYAESWYTRSRASIISTKGASSVLSYHNGSIFKALLDLFPDIGLQENLLSNSFPAKSLFHSHENQRQFFESYATANGFNPSNTNEWYSHPRAKIMATKGAFRVIYYHNNSVVRALTTLFPNLGWHKDKFTQKFYSGS